MIKSDQNICSLVSLLDNVDVLLVLHGRGVDGRSREGVVGVPDQAQRVDGPFHLRHRVEGKTIFKFDLRQNSYQVLVDNLSCFLLSNGFSSKLVKSCINWGEQGEGSAWG